MDINYFNHAKVLLEVLPLLQKEKVFALKGGTAINFFIRDLPRLSVDIDLAYLPINEREAAFQDINRSFINLVKNIERLSPDIKIILKRHQASPLVKGLVLNKSDSIVKIEPNLVIRGSVYKPEFKTLSAKAQNLFEAYAEAQLLSFADIYGGKICAALDRQHPRDLFDVHLLLRNEGITEQIKEAFIVYLISHPRPIVEILNPKLLDIKDIYDNEFKGLTDEEIEYEELHATRENLIVTINKSLSQVEKRFILTVKQGEPEWDLLKIKGIEKLPAVKWKIFNIKKMSKEKHKTALNKLRDHLDM